MSDDKELIDRVARKIAATSYAAVFGGPIPPDVLEKETADYRPEAIAAITELRAYDREQRAKIDESLADAIAKAKPCSPFVPTSKNSGPPMKAFSTYYDIINDCYHVQFADGTSEVVRAADLDKRRRSRAPSPEALARHNEAQHGGMNMYVETRRDPDDYRDPFSLVTRMARGPGITEG